ncbi:hypothetical protein [Yersinia enterocolitica]
MIQTVSEKHNKNGDRLAAMGLWRRAITEWEKAIISSESPSEIAEIVRKRDELYRANTQGERQSSTDPRMNYNFALGE